MSHALEGEGGAVRKCGGRGFSSLHSIHLALLVPKYLLTGTKVLDSHGLGHFGGWVRLRSSLALAAVVGGKE